MSMRLMLIGGVPPSLSRRLIRVSHSQSRFNGSMIRVSHHRFNGLIDHQLSSPSPAMTVKSNVGKNDITPEVILPICCEFFLSVLYLIVVNL